ncbi:OLC1v1018310C1 [Oldenlandia corymbosa var. corymbosa]|uniref:OLC1v1018310C1 n=1 Tax=Oldenlandia corymbosa var. corymbosa TaxID=529605 RepID=A0AAV1EBC8_OLDCO|nr:OLC1v1018310C1 [Oldenlandia corymbosa var. corymbosa]
MTFASKPSSSILLSPIEQEKLIEKLQVFTIQGRDKHGLALLRVVGKFFPARLVSVAACVKFLEEKIFPKLGDKSFSVLYVHTGVDRNQNFPGISALRSIYDAIPARIKDNLQTVYFLHPGLQSRLFLATFGRLIFTGGLYRKVKYVNRLDILWDNVRRKEVDIPEFVYDEDQKLDHIPVMIDFGMESDHPRIYQPNYTSSSSSPFDSELRLYSLRCIA